MEINSILTAIPKQNTRHTILTVSGQYAMISL
jgi:hypothetical protein